MDALVAAGVREAALSPGSRSAPLALALEAHPDVRTTVLVDERSAGFFALGAAKASGRPAVACTTSGTAVANLLPAVVEADHAGARLVCLTADRPAEMRGTGANQTILQPGLFGAFVRVGWDLPHPHPARLDAVGDLVAQACAVAQGPPAGPIHLNAPLREPLAPTPADRRLLAKAADRPRSRRRTPPPATLPVQAGQVAAAAAAMRGRGVVVVGPRPQEDGLREAVLAFARRARAPVLADPLSGLRYGVGAGPVAEGTAAAGRATGTADTRTAAARERASDVVGAYDAFLGSPAVGAALAPDWILQLGASPTSKPLRAWLAGLAAPRVKVDEDGRGWNDVPGDVRFVTGHAPAVVAGLTGGVRPAPAAWLRTWRAVERAARRALAAAVGEAPDLEPAVLPAVVRALRPGEALFVGNSLPVRDLDRFVPHFDAPLPVFSNRGASGIDGLVSTAAGVALVRGPVLAVVGDLSFQHDLGGLAALRAVRGRLRVVVVDNGGGQVFRHLPVAQAPAFERLFVARQDLDVGSAAAAFGLRHAQAAPSDLAATLTVRAGPGRPPPDVVAVRVPGRASVTHRRRAAQAAAQAAEEALRLLDGAQPS